jgi:hypothetical protein
MYVSVHPPSPYIVRHRRHLLPNWDCPVLSVLVVLQPCGCELLERSAIAEAQKHQLRQNFLQMGIHLVQQLQALGYAATVFDPRTGLPILQASDRQTPDPADPDRQVTPSGHFALDDVAVARSCLGYATLASHGCAILLHPEWGNAVYPSTLLSSAPPEIVAQVCHRATSAAGPLITARHTA